MFKQKNKAQVVIYLLIILASLKVNAQYNNLNFAHYSSRDGMASDHVDCIIQDHEGYMWFGTNQGLSMFDGLQFSTYNYDPNNQNTVGGNHILAIKEDKSNNLWLAVENYGLSMIDKNRNIIKNFQIPFVHEVEERYINTLFVEKDGSILVATERGLLRFDTTIQKYETLSLGNPATNVDFIALEKDIDDNCWAFGYDGEIYCRQRGKSNFIKINQPLKLGIVKSVYHSPQNEFWISASGGLYLFKPSGNFTLIRQNNLGNARNIDRLFIDDIGTYWIVNQKNKPLLFFPEKNLLQDLEDAWVTGLDMGLTAWKNSFIDRDRNIWIATELGVYMFNKSKSQIKTYGEISRFNLRNGNASIISMDHFNNDVVSITTSSLTIFDIDKNDITFVASSSAISGYKDIHYNCILRIGDYRWLVATNHGIYELEGKKDRYIIKPSIFFKTKMSFAQKEVLWLSSDLNKNIYISTSEDGLVYYDIHNKTFKTYLKAIKGKHNMSLKHVDFTEIANDGTVAARTHYGFALLEKGGYRFVPAQAYTDSLFDWSLLDITDLQELNSEWWISTQGRGLWSINPYNHTLKIFTEKNGLSSNYISSILEDQGKLILGTSQGLSIFHPIKKNVYNYFESDGLPSNQFSARSRYKSANGEFFFSTTNGLISFFVRDLKKRANRPLIKLSSISLNGENLSAFKRAEILSNHIIRIYHNGSVLMNFTPLTYIDVTGFNLRYRLNKDDEWRVIQNGLQVSLDNLDPKEYFLEVQLLDKNGYFMSDIISFKLEVIPPFYKTLGFIILSLFSFSVIVGLIVYAFFKQQARKEKRKMEALHMLETERTRIAMELHDDIGGNLTAVNLMTSMLSNSELDRRDKEIIRNISDVSNHMVDDMNEIVWALNSSNDSLNNMMAYIREHANQFFKHTSVSLDFSFTDLLQNVQVMSRVRRNIFLIYKESVNNILKHSSANEVKIFAKANAANFTLSIHDNGSNTLKMPAFGRSTGNGMENMRRRAIEIGGVLEIEKENGHTVRFSMPIEKMFKLI